MAAAPQVAVVGMRALRRDLAKLTDDSGPLMAAIRQAGKDAAQPVADVARTMMSVDTTPAKKPPHLTEDIRVSATKTGASIRMGRSSIRWAGWVEFGGSRKVPHLSTRNFQPRGRYLFYAAQTMAPHAAELYSAAVTRAFDNYPWSNTTSNGEAVHD